MRLAALEYHQTRRMTSKIMGASWVGFLRVGFYVVDRGPPQFPLADYRMMMRRGLSRHLPGFAMLTFVRRVWRYPLGARSAGRLSPPLRDLLTRLDGEV